MYDNDNNPLHGPESVHDSYAEGMSVGTLDELFPRQERDTKDWYDAQEWGILVEIDGRVFYHRWVNEAYLRSTINWLKNEMNIEMNRMREKGITGITGRLKLNNQNVYSRNVH